MTLTELEDLHSSLKGMSTFDFEAWYEHTLERKYDDGYQDGKAAGYDEGYEDGQSDWEDR